MNKSPKIQKQVEQVVMEYITFKEIIEKMKRGESRYCITGEHEFLIVKI